jgi:hypothetical protein
MTWLKFKHGTLKKQYNVTTILAPTPPSMLSPKSIIAPPNVLVDIFNNLLNGQMVFDNKKIQVLKTKILVHIILLIRIYGLKKIRDDTSIYYKVFFCRFFSIGLLMTLFTSSSKFFAINLWSRSHVCFLNAIIPLLLK